MDQDPLTGLQACELAGLRACRLVGLRTSQRQTVCDLAAAARWLIPGLTATVQQYAPRTSVVRPGISRIYSFGSAINPQMRLKLNLILSHIISQIKNKNKFLDRLAGS